VKRLIAASVISILVFALWVENFGSQPGEPVWRGRFLSQWLDDFCTNLSFPDETPPRSGFSDEEIEHALNSIGDGALPFLIKWLKIKSDNGWRFQVNLWLYKTGLLRFFHDVPQAADWQERAVDGFLYYGTNTLPLLNEVDKLTRSHDADMRMVAYEAAFFSRPPKALFIPIADRALKEKDSGDQAMAAQWMGERFPDEADKRGLRSPIP
jgi:hypothetical protein